MARAKKGREWSIERACGDTEDTMLYGSEKTQERQAAHLANKVCSACREAEEQAAAPRCYACERRPLPPSPGPECPNRRGGGS
jgi:hypothetical protein